MQKNFQNQYSNKIVTATKLKKIIGNRPRKKKVILCHGNFDLLKNIDQNDPSLKQLFKKIHNPEFNCNCILDPVFQFYSSALKEFISRSPEWVNTINATEGGSIFGDRIVCTKFHEFLQKYHS